VVDANNAVGVHSTMNFRSRNFSDEEGWKSGIFSFLVMLSVAFCLVLLSMVLLFRVTTHDVMRSDGDQAFLHFPPLYSR
jgi:hypothetical protein